MNAKVLILLGIVAVAAAGEQPSYSYERPTSYEEEDAKYEFSWEVKDEYGNDYGHRESRDGDHTEGEYYNHLPDGRLQKVTYYVEGDSGYVADVQYEGEASYDSRASNEYGQSRGYDD